MAKAGRGSDQFPLRLPDGLRDTIKRHAEANGRSMNSEIVHLLETGIFEADMARMEMGLEPLREEREYDKELIAHGKHRMEAIEQRKRREAAGIPEPTYEPVDIPFFHETAAEAAKADTPMTSNLLDQLFSKSKFAEEIEKLREELRAVNAAISRADKLLGED